MESADRSAAKSLESQSDVLRRRAVERELDIARDVKEAREAWERGACRVVTPLQIYEEMIS